MTGSKNLMLLHMVSAFEHVFKVLDNDPESCDGRDREGVTLEDFDESLLGNDVGIRLGTKVDEEEGLLVRDLVGSP